MLRDLAEELRFELSQSPWCATDAERQRCKSFTGMVKTEGIAGNTRTGNSDVNLIVRS